MTPRQIWSIAAIATIKFPLVGTGAMQDVLINLIIVLGLQTWPDIVGASIDGIQRRDYQFPRKGRQFRSWR